VAARLPGARLLSVPYVGHAVLAADDSLCTHDALAAFYRGNRVRSCAPARNAYPPRPLAPTRLGAATSAHVLAAVQLTVKDAFDQIDPGIFRLDGLRSAGGLRGGSYRLGSRGVMLSRDVFVPHVAVSGLIPKHGSARLTVSGALDGTLVFAADGSVRGRLGAHAVSGRAPLVRETVSERLRRRRALRYA
jgi:hypothetical protein